jgi:hypothetical protein
VTVGIKFSVGIPLGVIEPAGEFQSQEAAAQIGRTLESAGVAACYVTDHPAPVATWLHAHGHDATDSLPLSCAHQIHNFR